MKPSFLTPASVFVTLVTLQSLLLFNSCNSTTKINCTTPEAPSYTKDIAPVIEAKCFMCHAPDVYKKKAYYKKIYSYESLKKAGESGILLGSITHARGFIAMPYKKKTKIDTCSIALIAKWVNSGMKE